MSEPLNVRSRSQVLGEMIRKILVNTELSAVEKGSDIAILAEAFAAQISQVEVSSLKILESIDLDNLVGNALDKKAISMRIPNTVGGYGRKPAVQSNGVVTISSGDFNKISSKLYAGKPAPYAGSLTLFVDNASNFPATGDVYIGRGTIDRFEGKIPYSSVVNNGSYWTITLVAPLTKSHLHSDEVTLSQGGERLVTVGTKVVAPANTEDPAIAFSTLKNVTIPDGEVSVDVNVVCDQFGEVGNVLSGSISSFNSLPFPGAVVRNNSTYRNGRSVESDEDLRQRIRNYPSTLSRGTDTAILSAILGAVDPDTGRSIESASVLNPASPGEAARVFIDDGTGLEITFNGQASEIILKNAVGQELRFRVAQYPVTPAIAEGSVSAPFVIEAGMSITVQIDDSIETYTITPSNYANLNAATAYEIVRDFNSQSNIAAFRTMDNGKRIVVSDLSGEAEFIKVYQGDLQSILGLPTAEIRVIYLYKNAELLSFRGKTATLIMQPHSLWIGNVTLSDLEDVRVVVDGVLQTFSVTNADFSQYSTDITRATPAQWVDVFATKVAGVKFTVYGDVIVWSTRNSASASGSLEVLENNANDLPAGWIGTSKMWKPVSSGGVLSDTGNSKDFDFNRFTGEITLTEKPEPGSIITVATDNTKAHVFSKTSSSGLFGVTTSSVGSSKLILGFDGTFATRVVPFVPGSTISFTRPSPSTAYNVVRITCSSNSSLVNAKLSDWIYFASDTDAGVQLPSPFVGMFKICNCGYQVSSQDIVNAPTSGYMISQNTVSISTHVDSSSVVITSNGHGLKTGDLITTSTLLGLGGLTAVDLSVVDSPILVLDSNRFQYTAGATATSSATDFSFAMFLGTNRLRISHVSHDYSNGALVDVAFGMISETNLPILVVDADSYEVLLANAATVPTTSSSIVVTYKADTWIEILVASSDVTNWTPYLATPFDLTNKMIHLFKSTAIPQIVDFTGYVNVTADEAVSIINSQIVSGSASKVNPKVVQVLSNKCDTSGSCAVLAVIGEASSLFDTSSTTSIQSHVGYSKSQQTAVGSPVVSDVIEQSVPADGFATRAYLYVDKNISNIYTTGEYPVTDCPAAYQTDYPEGFNHLWLTGKAADYVGRVYNNQTTQPYTGVMTSHSFLAPVGVWDDKQTAPDSLNNYSNFGIRLRDIPLNNYNDLVAVMDLDPTNKTVIVPMYKRAKIATIDAIAGSGKGQVITFTLKDPDDSDRPFFAVSSVYSTFDFSDFKMLTKSVGLYRQDASDQAIILRSADYGAPNKLRFYVDYATAPDKTDFAVNHVNFYESGTPKSNVVVSMPSGAVIANSTLLNGIYQVSANSNLLVPSLFEFRISSGYLNNNNEYVVGNVMNIYGSSPIAGSYRIKQANSINWTLAYAETNPGTAEVIVTKIGHGLETGDFVNISASAALSTPGLADSQTVFFPTFAAAAAGDYVVLTDYTGSKWAVSFDKTGSDPQPTGLNFLAVPFSARVHANISACVTAADVAAVCNSALNGLVGFSGSIITSVAAMNGTMTCTATTVGTVPTFSPYNFNDSGAGSIAVTHPTVGFPANPAVLSILDLTKYTQITKISNDVFKYVSNYTGSLPSVVYAQGSVLNILGGVVVVDTPSNGGLSIPQQFDASLNPIRSWETPDKTLEDLRDAINAYLAGAPIVTAEAIGSSLSTSVVDTPTFLLYPQAVAYSGSSISGALSYHAFEMHFAGSAGIWQYDPNTSIKATVQESEPIFPTVTEAFGTSYNPINEEVMLVPTNTKTVAKWTEFKANSSLNLVATVSRIDSDTKLQIESKVGGSGGAVDVTGVEANRTNAAIIGNAAITNGTLQVSALRANARAMVRGSLVKVTNSVRSEFVPTYRHGNAALTVANTADISNYFRKTNSITYIQNNIGGLPVQARLIFWRNGLGSGQIEPLNDPTATNDKITLTRIGGGLVRVELSTDTLSPNILSARLGDQMYIRPDSTTFPLEVRCKTVTHPNGKVFTEPEKPEYLGYPVVHVVSPYEIVVIAPNLTADYTDVALQAATDLVFLPTIWNEKNIRTNHKEGIHFDDLISDLKAFYLIKTLGSGFVSVFLQNSATEAADDMVLSNMSVSTDDYVAFGDAFAPSNRGTYRLVAHNGRNHMIIYNPAGGEDEIVDPDSYESGGNGSHKWRVGPIDDVESRQIRIVAAESAKIGDYLRISTPSSFTQWFNDTLIGSWRIAGIGYIAADVTGNPAPYTSSTLDTLSLDLAYISPYVDVVIDNAPEAVYNSSLVPVSKFLIGDNASSIGFVEGDDFSVFRLFAGFATDPQNTENASVFLRPALSSYKFSETLGSQISVMNKFGFEERPFQGIDGYKYYTGLIRTAHRIIDGFPQNTALYQGVKAAGSTIEVDAALIKSVTVSLQIKPKDGVTLNSITDVVRSAVSGYVNGLGVGQAVVLSEVVRVVKGLPGVYSVVVVGSQPVATDDRIVCSQNEKPRILNDSTDIVIS